MDNWLNRIRVIFIRLSHNNTTTLALVLSRSYWVSLKVTHLILAKKRIVYYASAVISTEAWLLSKRLISYQLILLLLVV
jgi:hypothetical protein